MREESRVRQPLLSVQSLSCRYRASPVSTKPLHSKPHAVPPRGDTRQLGTARTQAGLQGLGASPPDVRHAGLSVCGYALAPVPWVRRRLRESGDRAARDLHSKPPNQVRHYTTTDQPKSCSDGPVVTAAGAGWR